MYEITRDDDGTCIAVGGAVSISVFPDGETRIFKRKAIKGVGSPGAREVEWVVAELDGVRVYVQEGRVIVTKRNLYP
jgi:hypothetical protein